MDANFSFPATGCRMESGKKSNRCFVTNSGEKLSNHSQPHSHLPFPNAGVVSLRWFFFVSLPPVPAFITTVRLILQPLADRHGGLFKRAETIIQPAQEPSRNRDRESHLGYELDPVHD